MGAAFAPFPCKGMMHGVDVTELNLMKNLILIRHAQACTAKADQHDVERELSSKGKRDALNAGEALRKTPPLPERILCSDAVRTTATARLIATTLELPETAVQRHRVFYTGNHNDLLRALAALPDSLTCVALVAHNPSISHLAGLLTGNCRRHPMDTSEVVRIECPANTWSEVSRQGGKIAEVDN